MRSFLPALLAPVLLAPALEAQEYRKEYHHECLISYSVHKDLGPIPIKLGDDEIYLRAKFEPVGPGNKIQTPVGAANWYLKVLEFRRDAKTGKPIIPVTGGGGDGEGIEIENLPEEIRKMLEDNEPVGTWEEHVRDVHAGRFEVEGRKRRGRSKSQPDYTMWEWKTPHEGYTGHMNLFWYNVAACFQIDENRQMVVISTMPAWKKGDMRRKHRTWAENMVCSLATLDEDEAAEAGINANRDKYADTEWKKEALKEAKRNVQSLSNWDYFTTPNYIILFSWDYDNALEDMGPSLRFAKKMALKVEECREHYMERFPPHDDMMQMYSVLRICYTREDFENYGGTPLGVVGWFNPGSKELVIFDDRENIYGTEEDTISTLFHEGWHQYGHAYFGEDARLHRWFDEGTGDFFGAYRKAGRRWKHTFDEGRGRSLKRMISGETYVPIADIVTWNKDKFYGARAADYYAEGYSIVEFLDKGDKAMGKAFDDSWNEIYDKYRRNMLELKDQEKAVEAAFEGVDFDKFEACWIAFVKKAYRF